MSGDVLSRKPVPPDATISYGSHTSQLGDLFLPSAPKGKPQVVVAIHGGFWRAQYDRKHLSHLCRAIARSGYAVWSLEYRRLGESGGGWPGTFDDVAAGAALLKKLADAHKLDLSRVTTLGHSAGGQLALWLATQSVIQVHNVVALAAVSDLAYGSELKLSKSVVDEVMGGSPAAVPERYRKASPSELLPLKVEQQLIHGADDQIVPFEMSRRYAEAARHSGDPITLHRLENTGHFELIDPESAAWPVVLAAIAR